MRWQALLAATGTVAALITPLTATAAPTAPTGPTATAAQGGRCSADARLLGFTDSLDKTTFAGWDVGGLSALAVTGPGRGLALVDNTTNAPARVYDLRIGTGPRNRPDVEVDDLTLLRRTDGTPYTGEDFDGEGLVVERGGRSILATSEVEPTIRRFRLSDGRETASLPVPSRFRVAPAGEATENATFESLAATPDGSTLYAGMEGPLTSDGTDARNRGLNRVLRYTGAPGQRYRVAGELAYRTDPGLSLVELAVVGRDRLVSLERTFVPEVGNTVRVFSVSLRNAPDVSKRQSLSGAPNTVFVQKKLLFDVVDCPPSGAVAEQPQPNPLLDNIEALALGGTLPGGRRQLYLLSDDNLRDTQITRFYSFAVDLR